jgi:hypothetical protein
VHIPESTPEGSVTPAAQLQPELQPKAAGAEAEAEAEEEGYAMTPEQLAVRLTALLDTCTYTVFSYTRRWGLPLVGSADR